MDLLKFEFKTGEEGSRIYNLGLLAKKLRYHRSNVAIDAIDSALPELRKIETELQNFDAKAGDDKRFYIQEITEELDKEDETKNNFLEEVERSSKSVVAALHNKDFSMADFSYGLGSNEGIFWIEFHGYKSQLSHDDLLHVVKEVFRSVSYKTGIIFIDYSLK
ncbi:MAG: hypothetical protein ABI863_09960 [Ginsengibacter sp.]